MPSKLWDYLLRRQLLVESFSKTTAQELSDNVDKALKTLSDKVEKTKGSFTRANYRKAQVELTGLMQGLHKKYDTVLTRDGIEVINSSADDLMRKFKKEVGEAIQTAPYVLPMEQISSFFKEPMGGQFMQDWINGHVGNISKSIKNEMVQSIILNETVGEASKRLRQLDGIGRKGATMISRTVFSSVNNSARREVYKKNKKHIKKFRFLATLDSRTTEICATHDGLTEERYEDLPEPPLHPNCRSIIVPLTRFDDDLERPAVISEERKVVHHRDGTTSTKFINKKTKTVPGTETFKDFFERQPDTWKKQWLGAERFNLYKENKLSFDDLIKNNRVVTSEAIQTAAEKAAREAAEKAAKETAEKAVKEAAEKEAREVAEKAAAEKAAREAIERAAKEKAAREAAEKAAREAIEREAKEKAAREAAEKAAREAIEREAKEKAAKEAAEKAAREAIEREAKEKAAKEAAEKAAKEVAEKAAKKAAEKAAKKTAEKAAKKTAEKEFYKSGLFKPNQPKDKIKVSIQMANERLDEVSREIGKSIDEIKKQTKKAIDNFVKDKKCCIRVDSYVMEDIVKSGRFKSQFETGGSGGLYDKDLRSDVENILFGYDKKLASKKRPIYGYLGNSRGYTSSNIDMNLDGYGEVRVILKDSIKKRTTITSGDSLDISWRAASVDSKDGAIPSPLLDIDINTWFNQPSANKDRLKRLAQKQTINKFDDITYNGYPELQMHGGVSVDDIEEVIFSSYSPPSEQLKRTLKNKNIKVSID